jgi:cytochrome bd-type quinol oxidase subunit 2
VSVSLAVRLRLRLGMATLVLKQPQTLSLPLQRVWRFNLNAFLSLVLAAIFILYFSLPHSGVFRGVFQLSVLYLIFIPAIAFVLSVVGLRQISRTHDRGIVFGVVALFVTSLYFIVALATPIVLLGLYIVYSYLLK